MPLFYTQTIDQYTRLAIWEITEPLPFFLEKARLSRQLSHPQKQLQHVAGRYLLQLLFPDFPMGLIQIADTRKPFVPYDSHHFSISHCGSFAAAIVSTYHRVGIDIEAPTSRLRNIVPKFLSGKEQVHFLPPAEPLDLKRITVLWSAKEALFKWYGLGQVDFKKHLHLQELHAVDDCEGFIVATVSKTAPPATLQIRYKSWPQLMLTWLIG